jgi:transposase
MDRGMVSEENLDALRRGGASWLVGTPKSMLRRFERELLDQSDWTAIPGGAVEVKLCAGPEGSAETFVLCRSPLRKEKEKAMRSRQVEKLERELEKLRASAEAPERPLRDAARAERRVGRLMGRYSRAAHMFDVRIESLPDPDGAGKTRLRIQINRKAELEDWAAHADGCYLLRTNLQGCDAAQLWKTYIGLTQIEDSFRIPKHDLGLRPVFHHTQERTQAHILVCFLALTMWRTLQHWMETSGLGTAPRKLLEEMAQVRSLDVILPTRQGTRLRLRTVCRPEPRLAILLQRIGLPLPARPRTIEDVVEKTGPKNQIFEQLEKSCR